jgi:nucleotide-binding universal stress UspA family protein
MITGYEVVDEVLRGVTDPVGLQTAARSRLETEAKEAGFPEAKLQALMGEPAAQLLALRSIVAADLVAVGTGHIRGLRRFLLGSVADRLLRNPGSPLLLVRRAPEQGRFRRVLSAVEYTDRVCQSLGFAAPLARHLEAELIALNVLPPDGYVSDGHRVVLEPEREARRLAHTLEALHPSSSGQVVLRCGDPAEAIPEAAQSLEADLVVVGAERQPDGWPGRVTDRVARAELPAVLVVWPPAGGAI